MLWSRRKNSVRRSFNSRSGGPSCSPMKRSCGTWMACGCSLDFGFNHNIKLARMTERRSREGFRLNYPLKELKSKSLWFCQNLVCDFAGLLSCKSNLRQ